MIYNSMLRRKWSVENLHYLSRAYEKRRRGNVKLSAVICLFIIGEENFERCNCLIAWIFFREKLKLYVKKKFVILFVVITFAKSAALSNVKISFKNCDSVNHLKLFSHFVIKTFPLCLQNSLSNQNFSSIKMDFPDRVNWLWK